MRSEREGERVGEDGGRGSKMKESRGNEDAAALYLQRDLL